MLTSSPTALETSRAGERTAVPSVGASGRIYRSGRQVLRILRSLIVIAVIVGIWQWLVAEGVISEQFLSSPTQIISAIFDGYSHGQLTADTLVTLQRVGVGWAAGCTLGYIMGLLVAFDPFTTRLRQTSGFRELTNFEQYIPTGGLSLGIIAGGSSYVASHPQVVTEFDAGIAQSIAYIQSNPQQAAALASKVLGLPTAVTVAALGNIKFATGGIQDMTTYNNTVTALKSVNLVPASFNLAKYVSK